MLPRLASFVEQERGLRFKAALQVTVLSDAAFERSLSETGTSGASETTAAVLRALGLLPADVDLAKVLDAADREGTVGFYRPDDGALVVRGGDATPLLRRVLVHELTHALDDQHFDTQRSFDSDEAAAGWDALLEGSAVRIEQRYVASLPRREQDEIQRAEEAQLKSVGELPALIELSLGFPYVYGPPLVEVLLGEGGRTRLDSAFASPPVSSEQVLDPSALPTAAIGLRLSQCPRVTRRRSTTARSGSCCSPRSSRRNWMRRRQFGPRLAGAAIGMSRGRPPLVPACGFSL